MTQRIFHSKPIYNFKPENHKGELRKLTLWFSFKKEPFHFLSRQTIPIDFYIETNTYQIYNATLFFII